MKTQYRTIDTSTLKGLETAERLHQNGWKMALVRFSSTQFYKQDEIDVDDLGADAESFDSAELLRAVEAIKVFREVTNG